MSPSEASTPTIVGEGRAAALLEFRVLGTLEVVSGGTRLALGPPKQRAVLAVLLLNAKQIVPAERLIDLVWGDTPPRTAAHSVQVYISELRRTLSNGSPDDVIQTRAPGYTIDADHDLIDARRFELLVESGTRELKAGDVSSGVETLREALRLWAQPFADFAYEEFAQAEIRRLTLLRLGALEELAAAELSLGHEHEVLSLVDAALSEDPLRERVASCRCWRSTDRAATPSRCAPTSVSASLFGRRARTRAVTIDPATAGTCVAARPVAPS